MKRLTLLFILITLTRTLSAQNHPMTAADAFNGFQRTYEVNPDSAIYFLTNLAMVEDHATDDLLHNSFAQSFMRGNGDELFSNPDFLEHLKKNHVTVDSARRKFNELEKNAYIILEKTINSQNKQIQENIYPIAQWVEAKKNKDKVSELQRIGQQYLSYLAEHTDFYSHRKARYGLLISGLMEKHEKLLPLAQQIQNLIYAHLDHYLSGEKAQKEWTRDEKMERAWYRYNFAAANYLAAGSAKNKADQQKLLKIAAQFSPDATDNTVRSAYFYEMFFLFNKEKYSFEEDYLATLENDAEKLSMLMEMSLKDPKYKANARAIYKGSLPFSEFWLKAFNENGKVAPLFSLRKLDGTEFRLENRKDKWTLIDFWGTWCQPCRKEHPDLQRTYQKTQDGKLPNLEVFTIASRDQEADVKAYMKKFQYSFPVAMSDNRIEKEYQVSSWPSKFLISPQGKFVIIPFGIDWQKYLDEYLN